MLEKSLEEMELCGTGSPIPSEDIFHRLGIVGSNGCLFAGVFVLDREGHVRHQSVHPGQAGGSAQDVMQILERVFLMAMPSSKTWCGRGRSWPEITSEEAGPTHLARDDKLSRSQMIAEA